MQKQTILGKTNTNKIFNVATDKKNVVCPPDQVFVRTDFDFLLTIGGDLITDENEYEALKHLLERIGETEFYALENIGATLTERETAFKTTIKLNGDYKTFQEKVREFSPPFGWMANHFFIFGQKESWGIYVCEYPTINIVGCDRILSNDFRQIFSINGNGYEDLKEFIRKEHQANPNLFDELTKQYRLGS
ncbi:MAG: hypothetical protein H7Z72_20675 [Bacteroidetes bacterium]|nr:hypothetical protein [Fibrella sp.]